MFDFKSMMQSSGDPTTNVGASPLGSQQPSNFNIQSPEKQPFDMNTFMTGLQQHISTFQQPITSLQDSYKKTMGGLGITGSVPIQQLNMQTPQMQSQNFSNPTQNQQVLQQYFAQRGR